MEITPEIQYLVDMALREDLSDKGDITSQLTIPDHKKITATMHSRNNGIIAGMDLASYVFKKVNDTLEIEKHTEDGQIIKPQQKILTVRGHARSILSGERVALNFLSHLSAIATQTRQYVDAVSHTKAKILDTRKTLPAYRVLHKYAVKAGGGMNHRMGLHDMILIKDNHIAAAGSVRTALDAAQKSKYNVKIEIEVDTLEQLQEVLDHGAADIVMLDNMSPELLQKAVKMVEGKILTEASGGVNLDSVRAIAESGVDYISVGALTHSVKVLDIGLDISD